MENKLSRFFRYSFPVTLFLAGCSGLTSVETPTIPEGNLNKSPVIICSAPDPDNPGAIAMIIFEKVSGGQVEMNLERFSGSKETVPLPDGSLIPFTQDQVQTGLDINVAIGKRGNEIIFVNIGNCLVMKKELKTLHQFFKGIKPDDLQDRIGFNGKPKKFELTVVNPREKINPFGGIKNFRQLSFKPEDRPVRSLVF